MCIALDPTFPKGHSRKATALSLMEGRLSEALVAFEKGIVAMTNDHDRDSLVQAKEALLRTIRQAAARHQASSPGTDADPEDQPGSVGVKVPNLSTNPRDARPQKTPGPPSREVPKHGTDQRKKKPVKFNGKRQTLCFFLSLVLGQARHRMQTCRPSAEAVSVACFGYVRVPDIP
jgi:hypothetical protein